MPYIADLNIRKALDKGDVLPRDAGELNYCITRSFIKNGNVLNVQDIERCLDNFILAHKLANKKMNYQAWNDLVGAMLNAWQEAEDRGRQPIYWKLEKGSDIIGIEIEKRYFGIYKYYYKKYIRPYENTKIKTNGDVL